MRISDWSSDVCSSDLPSSFIILAVGPFTALPPTIGDTAITGARDPANASLIPGTARIGSTLRNGLEGANSTASQSGFEMASMTDRNDVVEDKGWSGRLDPVGHGVIKKQPHKKK